MPPHKDFDESIPVADSDHLLTELEVAHLFHLLPKELEPFRKAGILKGEPYRELWWHPFFQHRYSLHQLIRLMNALLTPHGVYQVFANELPEDWKHPHFPTDVWTVESQRETALLPIARMEDILLKNAIQEGALEIHLQHHPPRVITCLRRHENQQEWVEVPI